MSNTYDALDPAFKIAARACGSARSHRDLNAAVECLTTLQILERYALQNLPEKSIAECSAALTDVGPEAHHG